MTNKKYVIGVGVIISVTIVWFMVGRQSAIAPSGPETTSTAETGLGGAAGNGESPATTKETGATSVVPTPSAMTKSGAYIVSYTKSGFSPTTLIIKRGKSVRFVNNSAKAMSIMAVDQNSQIYRELNQEQSVARAEFYDFTFGIAGTWVYTNRNNRLDRGTIIVE